MSYIKEHVKISKEVFGDASLGQEFQELLDEKRFELGKNHRKIDHDYERLMEIVKKYGEQGKNEIILHLVMDYKLYRSKDKYELHQRIKEYFKQWYQSLPPIPELKRRKSNNPKGRPSKATIETLEGLSIAHFCNDCLPISRKKSMYDKAGGF